jgi:putative SOS response-associated peptidase YedK
MCGRYSLTIDFDVLEDRFTFRGGIQLPLPTKYNIAPTQEVLTVVNNGSENQVHVMKWGLIPFWAKDPKIGSRMINARAETVVEKPVFREAFSKRRCLVLADGFYEWQKTPEGKAPMRIVLKSGEPFGFAGLWATWKSADGQSVNSCTIITTTANSLMEPIHDRMPVILSREAERDWLDVANTDTGELRELLVPYAASEMEAYRVPALINSWKNESPDVAARAVEV